MLLTNICCEDGLSNSCTGTVKDFMFDDAEIQNHDSHLLSVVWVEIDNNIYTGPTYFPNNNDHRNWVPIDVNTCYVTNVQDKVTSSCTMCLLCLCWSFTP